METALPMILQLDELRTGSRCRHIRPFLLLVLLGLAVLDAWHAGGHTGPTWLRHSRGLHRNFLEL